MVNRSERPVAENCCSSSQSFFPTHRNGTSFQQHSSSEAILLKTKSWSVESLRTAAFPHLFFFGQVSIAIFSVEWCFQLERQSATEARAALNPQKIWIASKMNHYSPHQMLLRFVQCAKFNWNQRWTLTSVLVFLLSLMLSQIENGVVISILR